ncbi:MAG: hypothetical protein QOD38_1440 [Acidimicrobiaceae bacterium]
MTPLRVSLLALTITLAASCAGRTEERSRAETAAVAFYEAVAQQDGIAACALLAPETQHEVETSAKQPCDEAITDEDLPDELGRVTETTVFGNEARVMADGDTVFVSDFDGFWRVVAAGCTTRGDVPYDCELKGG